MKNEIEEKTEEEELTDMCKDILEMLVKTKKAIIDKFMEYNYDAAYFNVDINLKTRIDDKVITIKEKWNRLE